MGLDPITAALNLANTIAEIIKLNIESQPPELRAEIAKQGWADFLVIRTWIASLLPKGAL